MLSASMMPGRSLSAKTSGPLVRARCEHDLPCPHLPQPFPRQVRRRRLQVVREALHEHDVIMIVVAEGRGARENEHVLAPVEGRDRLSHPVLRRHAVDRGRHVVQERASGLRLLVDEHHALAGLRRRERGGETGRARADHEHVAMGMAVGIAVRIALRSARGRGRRRRGCRARRPCPRRTAAT